MGKVWMVAAMASCAWAQAPAFEAATVKPNPDLSHTRMIQNAGG